MIKIENTEIFGWEAAIRGMRNPKNSWDKSDSVFCLGAVSVGDNDLKLMNVLANAGTDHGKFLRMITVYVDITAPLYWWKEFDTYKVGTVANSCSTMHKIHAKEFLPSDFSIENLTEESKEAFEIIISLLNKNRDRFNGYETRLKVDSSLTDAEKRHIRAQKKQAWWQMIQLLPTSYNQKRTVMLNYAVLKNMYKSRKDHKLDEWHDLCHWAESLPYSELIIGKDG